MFFLCLISSLILTVIGLGLVQGGTWKTIIPGAVLVLTALVISIGWSTNEEYKSCEDLNGVMKSGLCVVNSEE